MSVVTQLYFQIVSALFWVGHHHVETRNIGENSYTTMWTSRIGERNLVLQCLGICLAIYTGCGICDGYVENTTVLPRTSIHLICTSIESHNGDDATKDQLPFCMYLCTDKQIDLVHLFLISVGKMLSCAVSGGQRLYYTRMAASS
jgi:hypothetical protein